MVIKTISNKMQTGAFLILLMMLMNIAPLQAADITVSVDRNPVQMDESFQVVFEVNGKTSGDPDFSPLHEEFDILSQNQSSSIQIINGNMSSTVKWILTLMAKTEGELYIPSIRFGKDLSKPYKMTITKSPLAGKGNDQLKGELFLEVTAQPEETYVQGQIIYTVRLYRAVNLGNASLSEPEFNNADAVIEKLGDDSEFETRRNGNAYRVVERRYAIFPQQSGKLTINPVVFEGQIIQTSSRFMIDPFARSARTKRLRSEAIEINVKPVPVSQQGKHWLPAQEVKLVEEWPENPPQFKVGEAVTRTLTLAASGLTAAQLPSIDMAVPDGFKNYPDKPVLQDQKKKTGIIGVRQEKIALIPSKPGEFTLPQIEIEWWNTKTKRTEIARLPAKNIQVAAADGRVSVPQNIDTESVESRAADEALNKTLDKLLPDVIAENNVITQEGIWPWLSLLLAIGWMSTLVIMWWRGKNIPHAEKVKKHTDVAARKAIEKKLRQACANNNAKEAKSALLAWAKDRFQENPPTSLGELGKRIGGRVAEEIENLNQVLYSQSPTQWHGQSLLQAIDGYNNTGTKENKNDKDILVPLYP